MEKTQKNLFWARIQTRMRSEFGRSAFDRWLKQLRLEDIQDKIAILSCDDKTTIAMIENQYSKRLLMLLQSEEENIHQLKFIALSFDDANEKTKTAVALSEVHKLAQHNHSQLHEHRKDFVVSGSDFHKPNYITNPSQNNRFDRFIIGVENRLAYSCAFNIAETFAQNIKPKNQILMIHGKPGLGKTHLLEAIFIHLNETHSHLNIVLLTAENFARDFIESLSKKTMSNFKQTIRSADLLLLDDIHFIGSKNSIQEELLHSLNDLLKKEACIVMTSLYMPKDISGLSNSIRSRLAGALCASVQPLGRALTKKLIKVKASESGIDLDDNVATHLSEHLGDDVRLIEGNIATLAAQSLLLQEPISIELCQQTLHARQTPKTQKSTTIDAIQNAVASYYHVSLSELSSARRNRSIVRPRHVAMYLAKELTLRSLPEIGRMFGKRDHSTVHHAISQIEYKRKREPELEQSIVELIHRIESGGTP